ncbi:MAG: signal peptidase II [Clostridiales bacterium]|nr:signal peptidase II [Clostridiales bacterium]
MNRELKKPTWMTYVIFSELFVVLVFIDQFTKDLIVKSLALSQVDPIIDNFLSLMYVRNTGSAFSLFSNKSWGVTVLSVISSLALILLLFLAFFVLARFHSRRLSVCLIFLSAGTLGNLIDRIRLKYVVDFIRFDFGSYTFPIFNVADIYVTLSCIVLAVILLFNEKYIPEIPFGGKKEEEQKESGLIDFSGKDDEDEE